MSKQKLAEDIDEAMDVSRNYLEKHIIRNDSGKDITITLTNDSVHLGSGGWRCAIRKGGEVTDVLETTSHVEALNFIEFHMCASDA